MAVAFDAQSAVDTTGNAATSFSDGSNLTIGNGANRALVVLISWGSPTAPAGVSITWDGQPLTLVPNTSIGNASSGNNGGFVSIYALLNPNPGTKILAGSWTDPLDFYVGGVSFTGVDQSSIAAAFPNGVTPPNSASVDPITITSAVADAVVAVYAVSSTVNTVSGPTTAIYLDNVASGYSGAGVWGVGASPSQTLTVTGVGNSSTSGCDIKAAAGGGPSVPMMGQGWM